MVHVASPATVWEGTVSGGVGPGVQGQPMVNSKVLMDFLPFTPSWDRGYSYGMFKQEIQNGRQVHGPPKIQTAGCQQLGIYDFQT